MVYIKATLTTILALASLAIAQNFISEECKIDKNSVTCECIGNEEFYLPADYGYTNTTRLIVSSCSTAMLLFPQLSRSMFMKELIVRNISELLNLDLLLGATNISRFELTNIKKIPWIRQDTFVSVANVGNLEIRNVFIENFVEQFGEIKVNELVMINVTIARAEGFALTERGKNLRIVNCEFRNISSPVYFYFSNVTIVNSMFTMQKPGHIHIVSDYALVRDNVLFNITMNLSATTSITINGTCADGTSTLRLDSNNIMSFGNRLPNDINYSSYKQNDTDRNYARGDNVICIAGNCKCPKSSGQNRNRAVTEMYLMQIFAIWLMFRIQRS